MEMAQIIFKREIDEPIQNFINPQPKFEEQYCRLCLSTNDTQFKQLFTPFNPTQSIVEILEDFAKVLILPEDEYSKLICCSCFIKLTESQNFKNLIEHSDVKLRNRRLRNDVIGEDSDHEKVDVDEIDLKKELIIGGRELSEDGCNSSIELIENDDSYTEIGERKVEVTELNIRQSGGIVGRNKINIKKKLEVGRQQVIKKSIKKEYHYQLKCPECDKVFKRHGQRAMHLITSHTRNYPFHCSVCNKGFAVKGALIVHEKQHTGKKDYQCEICGKSFMQSSSLINHRRTHKDEKQFKCDQCPKEYTNKHFLKLHIASIHSSNIDKLSFLCEICNKTYPTQFHLRNHVRRTHKQRERVTCDICGKSVTNYSKHMKGHIKPYKCNVCNRSFSYSKTLKEHSTVHTGEKLYECDICKKSFGFSGALYTHKKIHDKTKQIQCEFCVKQFTYKHNWRVHMEKAHQKKEND